MSVSYVYDPCQSPLDTIEHGQRHRVSKLYNGCQVYYFNNTTVEEIIWQLSVSHNRLQRLRCRHSFHVEIGWRTNPELR
jgi:hypothetical protein